jgi:hypothetical protein
MIHFTSNNLNLGWVIFEELGYWYDLTKGTRTDLRTGEQTKDWDRNELFDNLGKTK